MSSTPPVLRSIVALRDAAREAIETARAATELPVLMGTPES